MKNSRFIGKILGGMCLYSFMAMMTMVMAQENKGSAAPESSAAAKSVAPEGNFVAGVQPDQRPANAPVIKEMLKSRTWYDKAVTGVVRPFPASMRFLEVQGNWYNPFTVPGMCGRYDIRNWHQDC